MRRQSAVEKVVSIDSLRRRRLFVRLRRFGWSFLGTSAIVFWVESAVVVLKVLLFPAATIGRSTLVFAVLLNLGFSVLFALVEVIDDDRRAPVRSRSIALSFHPVGLVLRLPFFLFVRARWFFSRRKRPQQYNRWSCSVAPDGDDDHAA